MPDVFDSNKKETSPPAPEGKIVPPWVSAGKELASPAEEASPAPAPSSAEISAEQPKPAAMIKESPFKKIFPLVILLLIGTGLFFLVTKIVLPWLKEKQGQSGSSQETETVNLKYWGLWEAESIMKPIIEEYQKKFPNVVIDYSQQSYKDYRERLQSALARGDGPDIFRFHNTWVVMLNKELAPAPAETASALNLEENYYSVANRDLINGSQVLGVPLGIDGLALFYNSQLLKEAGKAYPTTWEEVQRTAVDLCVAETEDQACQPGEKIKTAGVALGAANNVDHFSDIIGLMMLQNGVDLAQPTAALMEDALEFYTLFTKRYGVWDETLPNSTYAFATEKVAMIFAPSWRAHEIAQINPELEFKTTAVPQLPGTKVSWASYWVEGVSNKSDQVQAAWEFLEYLSNPEVLTKLYTQASQVRDFGEPYPRKDLAEHLKDDPIVGAFVEQAPYAQSWYLCSATHDNGINDKMIKYFEDGLNSILAGESISQALVPVVQGINQVLSQYGLATAPSQ